MAARVPGAVAIGERQEDPLSDQIRKALKCFLADDGGATAIEYALLLTMFAMTIIPFMPGLNQAFRDNYADIAGNMQ